MTQEKHTHKTHPHQGHKAHTSHTPHIKDTESDDTRKPDAAQSNTEKSGKKKQIKKWIKRIIILILIVAGGSGAYAWFGREKPLDVSTITAEKGELIQEVSITGRVKPAESVDLNFEVSGKVSEILVSVGDKVEIGKKLISLDSSDLVAQLKKAQAGAASSKAQLDQYQAAIDAQQAKLEEYKKGTRPEEISIAKTTVTNAEKSLEDAEKSLENVKSKAETDMQNAHSGALTALLSAVTSAKGALLTLTDIQYAHFNTTDTTDTMIAEAKKEAVYSLLGEMNGGRWQTSAINAARGGVYGTVQNIDINAANGEIEEALIKTLTALQKTKNALNAIPINLDLTSTEKTSINTEKTSIDTEITAISAKKQAIAVQKATNESAVQTAENAVNTSKNVLSAAQENFKLAQAGYTEYQIKAQEAQVAQAKASYAAQKAVLDQAYANIQSYQAQIAKTVLKAPITGIVTKVETKTGEIVFGAAAGVPVISIISDKNFEIEANIPEVDVAKIQIGDKAEVTLDAYGSDVLFEAVIIKIDPAETIIEGVPTYKVTFQFTEISDQIKSGMTANIDISTDKRENVIAIPQRAVIEKDGKKYVRILYRETKVKTGEKKEKIVETEVTTGLRGSDGRVEILKGISEGNEVITSVNE